MIWVEDSDQSRKRRINLIRLLCTMGVDMTNLATVLLSDTTYCNFYPSKPASWHEA